MAELIRTNNYRALACLVEGGETLVCTGRSIEQVERLCPEALAGIAAEIAGVVIQRWHGTPECGRWIYQCTISLASGEVREP